VEKRTAIRKKLPRIKGWGTGILGEKEVDPTR